MSRTRLVNRNVLTNRGRTSIRFEPEFWAVLHEMCCRERTSSIHELIKRIEAGHSTEMLTSAVLVAVLKYYIATAQASSAAHNGSPVGDTLAT